MDDVDDDQPPRRRDGDPFAIDPTTPRVARLESFLAGGDAHFAADRAATESLGDISEAGLGGLRYLIGALRAFTTRTVTVLTGDLGVRQYLHIGMSTPTTGMVHHVAAKLAPETRVVYVSYDPTVLAHVHVLDADAGTGEGAVAHVYRAVDDGPPILRDAGTVLDLTRPVAVVLPTTLNLLSDEVAHRLVDDLRAALVPGSYLVLAHTSLDLAGDAAGRAIEKFNEVFHESYVVRPKAEILRFLGGFELVEPGLVPIERWRPDDPAAAEPERLVPIYGAIARRS